MSATERNHVCYFAGSHPSPSFEGHTFEKTFHVPWSPEAKLHLPYYWDKVKAKVSDIVKEVDPDIIHAHDVFAGRVSKEICFPFVYDSHEYWSIDMPLKLVRRGIQILALKHFIARSFGLKLWAKWQEEIVSKTPTLTISQKAVDSLRKHGEEVYLLPNFPHKYEVDRIQFLEKNNEFSCAYIGNDITTPTKHRNVDYLKNVFSESNVGILKVLGDKSLESTSTIHSLGFLPYKEMLQTLTSFHVGLLPWVPHPYHKFCQPNKIADYAHAGLLPIISGSLKSAIELLGKNCIVFEKPSELSPILKKLIREQKQVENTTREIIDFARQTLIWDVYEENIFKAYNAVL